MHNYVWAGLKVRCVRSCQRIGINFIKTIWIPITLGYVMKYIFQDQKKGQGYGQNTKPNYSNGDKVSLAIESLEGTLVEAYPPIVVILGMELLNTEFRYFVSIGVMDMLEMP